MRARHPVRVVALSGLLALGVVGAALPGAASTTDPDTVAAQLLERTRDAALRHDFAGSATVGWVAPGGGAQDAQVDVTATDGTIEVVSSNDGVVVDQGDRTFVRDALGWTATMVEPDARSLPEPGRRWRLRTAGARIVAGRPTTVVEVARPDGQVAQRLAIDDATGVVLERAVLGPDGRRERSLRFTSFALDPARTRVAAPTGVASKRAPALRATPSGYRAPKSVAGFELVTRSRHPDGVLLFYSDGVFTASVFEQPGDLEWGGLPKGGTTSQLADTRTKVYREPSGDVAVWARDGLVYTCVTDAPSDVFARMVGALVAPRSAPQSVADFVLGPFGWG